jgi:hypothetical protein
MGFSGLLPSISTTNGKGRDRHAVIFDAEDPVAPEALQPGRAPGTLQG